MTRMKTLKDGNVKILVEAVGVKKEDIKVTLSPLADERPSLTIKFDYPEKYKMRDGSFKEVFENVLFTDVEPGDIKLSLKKGMLKVIVKADDDFKKRAVSFE